MKDSLLISHILASVSQRIVIPSDFHSRVEVVKEMLDNDVSGIVDSLTDFAVDTATVDFAIESDNDELTKILNEWLEIVNQSYLGKFPSGIKALAKEYFKERWKGSSFPVLKLSKWDIEYKSKMILPSRMHFLDGASIYGQDKDTDSKMLSLDQYDYFIGKGNQGDVKLSDGVIFSRPNGRWFDKYPNVYLIKRGVYKNWKIIESLKNNELDVLNQVVPYLFWVKKGTERLALEKGVNYNDDKLQAVINQFENLISKAKNNNVDIEKLLNTPMRASQFDEEIKHLIPDLEALFKSSLFEQAEKAILAGLGFIDVIDGATSTRRESILNPKPFIQEVESAVEDFKQIIKDLLYMIKKKNESHIKYMNVKTEIVSTPIKGFMTDKFKERIRQLWDRGQVSSKTAVELIGELDFEIEVKRREKEAKEGIDVVMYPHLTENKEDKGFDVDNDMDNEPTDDKTDLEAKNFDQASLKEFENKYEEEMELIGSPYESVKDLPKGIKDKIKSLKHRRTWLGVFNGAYNYYKGKGFNVKRAESLAFATAWSKYKKRSKSK